MKNSILLIKNVNLKFRIYRHKNSSLKESISNLLNSKIDKTYWDFHALKDINLELFEGDRLGIIGKNGSGKSSLLKIISKVYQPNSGIAESNLKITPLLESQAAFNPEYTGRENIYLNGAISGLSRLNIRKSLEDIISFSEIGDFIDIPVKNYSTGMYMRLAFAAATAFQPELLIIDEIFLGGDYKFIEKGKKRLKKLINKSKGMIIVSHDHELLKELCNRFIWIDHGLIREIGDSSIVDKYLNY